MARHSRLTPTIAALLLVACGGAPDNQAAAINDLDNQLTANAADPANDPALKSALKDQIMVDPALVQQANDGAVRPPVQPAAGAVPPDDIATRKGAAETDTVRAAPAPSANCRECAAARRSLTLGALAAAQGTKGNCAANIGYSNDWANRLPREIPLYPDARVLEAAGADGQGCALRVVSFASAAPMQRLLDYYYTRASDAGYAAQHKADGAEHVIAGTKRDGAGAFMAIMRARKGGGTEVDLMADGGD